MTTTRKYLLLACMAVLLASGLGACNRERVRRNPQERPAVNSTPTMVATMEPTAGPSLALQSPIPGPTQAPPTDIPSTPTSVPTAALQAPAQLDELDSLLDDLDQILGGTDTNIEIP